jgi:SAM-dependent methyltransferase
MRVAAMAFSLEDIVPWGRSYAEYLAMFNLGEAELARRILGCGDGPAGFNAGLSQRGGQVVSVDPVYAFDAGQIEARIAAVYPTVLAQARANREDFVWEAIASVEHLGAIRMEAMNCFLADFAAGKRQGRYLTSALPVLPFPDQAFDLALCSHLLFLYSAHFDLEFHLQALLEMLRVAKEARIFPVLQLDGAPSPYIGPVCERLAAAGFACALQGVAYEFQRGGNQMLRIYPQDMPCPA